MKQVQRKSFYVFDGKWFEAFDKLLGVIQPKNATQFTIWESKSNIKGHLLIKYGAILPDDFQLRCDFRQISESDFEKGFRPLLSDYVVHGFNEFHEEKRKYNLPQLRSMLSVLTSFFM